MPKAMLFYPQLYIGSANFLILFFYSYRFSPMTKVRLRAIEGTSMTNLSNLRAEAKITQINVIEQKNPRVCIK